MLPLETTTNFFMARIWRRADIAGVQSRHLLQGASVPLPRLQELSWGLSLVFSSGATLWLHQTFWFLYRGFLRLTHRSFVKPQHEGGMLQARRWACMCGSSQRWDRGSARDKLLPKTVRVEKLEPVLSCWRGWKKWNRQFRKWLNTKCHSNYKQAGRTDCMNGIALNSTPRRLLKSLHLFPMFFL